jgi:hypothetical protein
MLDFNVFEFIDRVYDMKTNRFYKSDTIKSCNLIKLCTTKFYNKSYGWAKNNKPEE